MYLHVTLSKICYNILVSLTDIDECSKKTALCEYDCDNTPPGSYTCSCPDGYNLADNGFSCIGENK